MKSVAKIDPALVPLRQALDAARAEAQAIYAQQVDIARVSFHARLVELVAYKIAATMDEILQD